MSEAPMEGAALPPPATFLARFTVHGPDVQTLGARGVDYARRLAGGAYEVTGYAVSAVDLVRVERPDRPEDPGLVWACTVEATLTLLAPPAEDTSTTDGSTTTA